jgi:hypothetical protein
MHIFGAEAALDGREEEAEEVFSIILRVSIVSLLWLLLL